MRDALAVAELSLAFVLLVGASLLVRSFVTLLSTDPGFRAERVVAAAFSLPYDRYAGDAARAAFFRTLLERVRELPGVSRAGLVTALPLTGVGHSTGFEVEGRPIADPTRRPLSDVALVSEGYFAAMGVPLLRGRDFTTGDDRAAPRVAVINQTLARRFSPGEDPIGKRIVIGYDSSAAREIVGVVADVRHYNLDAPPGPQTYLPLAQEAEYGVELVVRTTGDVAATVAGVRQVLRALDPAVPLERARPMAEVVGASVAQRRFTMQLLGALAALALVLAVVGVYGVMSYAVSLRTREFGIRIAVGARAPDVLRMVLGEGARIAGAGLALGAAVALGATRLMRGVLYGVAPTDPPTFAGVAILLAAVSLLAALLPARQATRVDPLVALRAE
jgi:putative ABC transport system permease protein